jgi:hypothetical protein
MGGYALEEFVGDLLKRMERVPGADPRLVSSSRNGTSGQKQGGVDHRGVYSDGTRAGWSCKEKQSLTKADIDTIIKQMTDAGETAERRIIVYSRIASAAARKEIAKHAGWEIWDQVDLSDRVKSLLVQDARPLLDTHFDKAFRRQFLPITSTDAFLLLDDYFAPLLRSDDRFHHRAALVGRDDDVAAIVSALTDPSGPRLVIVEGPAGRGKSRLVLAALQQVQEQLAPVPVIVRAEGHVLDSGALDELPITPTVLLVEDAHRDPAELAVLLQYAHSTDGVRVVLTTRPFATDASKRVAVTAKFDLTQIMVHTVKPLTAAAARQLVEALQDDKLRLTTSFAHGLAQAARATPLLAIVAVEMIRRGELSTALGLNPNLRQEIMTRYGEVATTGVAGASAQQTRKILATVAALSQLRLDDKTLIDTMATFLAATRLDLLLVLQALAEHGALLDRDGAVVVVPEMLGDQLLDEQAVVMGQDSGFSDQLWQAFPQQRLLLVASLASVDWRLRRAAGSEGTTATDVFSSIWSDFRAWFLNADHDGRRAAFDAMPAIAATQGARVLALLQDTIARPAPVTPGGWSTDEYTRRQCSGVAGICADADAALLSGVFDLLWEIAETDGTDPDADADHPVRVLERLARLDADEVLTTAGVLLDRVAVWLDQPARAAACRSPLGVVEPLLAKSGTTQLWQANALEFRAYTVEASSVRGIRDRIRQLLAPVTVAADVARAVEAVELLGTALREVVGYFGRDVPADTIMSWTDDDLQTIAVLSDAAAAVTEPLVRCHIRSAVAWHAAYAASAEVREAARTLLAAIEAHHEDLLTDLLATADHDHFSFEDIAPDLDSATTGDAPDDGETALARYERTVARREQERQRVAQQLWHDAADPNDVLDRLADRLTLIAAVRAEPAPGLEQMLSAVVDARPSHRLDLFQAIVARPQSPLDDAISVVLGSLLDDPPSFLQALQVAVTNRPSLAAAALVGFARPGWGAVAADAATIIIEAAAHPDVTVRDCAVRSAGAWLRADPLGAAALLTLFVSSSPDAVASAVAIAAMPGAAEWVNAMTDTERRAVLALLAAPRTVHPLGRLLLIEIARVLPTETIDVLAAHAEGYGSHLLRPGWGLDRGFADQPAPLIAWIQRAAHAAGLQRNRWARVWSVVAGNPISQAASTAISAIAATGTDSEVIFLAQSLENRPGFALDQPLLVSELVAALSRHPASIHDEIRGHLQTSGMPRGTSRTPGQPAQANVVARDRAEALSETADMADDVRELYRGLRDALQHQIDRDLENDQREADR